VALIESIADRKPRERVETEVFTGYREVRRYKCPPSELATHLSGALALGAVIPGASGTTPEQARLVSVSAPQQGEGMLLYVSATFIEIDCGAAALSTTTFRFTTKSSVQDGQHEKTQITYGVASTTSDGGIPAVAKTDVRDAGNLTGTTPTALADSVCRSVTVIASWNGRVLIQVEYAALKPEATYG